MKRKLLGDVKKKDGRKIVFQRNFYFSCQHLDNFSHHNFFYENLKTFAIGDSTKRNIKAPRIIEMIMSPKIT